MARRSDVALSREGIRHTAFALLEEQGLDCLTMRSLARRLDVQAPSLYSHYRDKAELVSEMAAEYFIAAIRSIGACNLAETWLQDFGIGIYSIFIENRDAARLFAFAEPLVQSDMISEQQAAQPLMALGLSLERAIMAQAAIISLALGSALDHSNEKRAAFLNGFFDLDKGFREALAILAKGLASPTG